MKKVAQMYDSKIGKAYDLVTMEAKEFVSLVQNKYEQQGITPLFAQRFNQELEASQSRQRYSELLTSIVRMKAGLKHDFHSEHHNLESYEKLVKEAEEKFLNGTLFTEQQNNVAQMGYELMPFAISVKDKDLSNQSATLELLDGFRRIFYTHDIPNQEVLVKVYEPLDDADWMSAMIVFNSWKFAKEANNLYFFDRGLKLGLYKRYGIDFPTLLYYGRHTYEYSLQKYVAREPYETLWKNERFAQDIRFIEQVKRYQPVFTVKKKKGDQVFDAADKPYELPYFLEAIHDRLCSELGRYRRFETKAILNGETLTRKTMEFDDYVAFLQEKELQKHFIKLSEMAVPGFMDNYVEKHLANAIRLIVHPTLAHQEKQA